MIIFVPFSPSGSIKPADYTIVFLSEVLGKWVFF